MKLIEIEVTGIAPLLCNRFPTEDSGTEQSKAKTKIYVPADIADRKLYKDSDGKYCIPGEHIFQSMRKAATDFKFSGKKTYKDVVTSGIAIDPELIEIISDKPYEIDARPVVIQRARVLSWRPKFVNWKLRFTLQILDDENISVAVVKEILEKAGATKGVGDYRPRFGRFMVTSFQEKK